MRLKSALATLLFALPVCSFAAEPTIKCPDITELKSGHFTDASEVYDTNLWEVIQSSSLYGTKDTWNFKVNIEADDKDNAIKLADATLNAMHLISGPEKVDNQWMCHYRSGQHDAVAILKLPAANQPTVASAKQITAKKKPV